MRNRGRWVEYGKTVDVSRRIGESAERIECGNTI